MAASQSTIVPLRKSLLSVKGRDFRLHGGLSAPLQMGKAAEHLACAELLMQGWNACLADAGLPYDILVELRDGRFARVQVKSTGMDLTSFTKKNGRGRSVSMQPVYRFALRKSRTGCRRIDLEGCDHLAFVALRSRLVAFPQLPEAYTGAGDVKTLIEFKSRAHKYERFGASGPQPTGGRYIEDYSVFNPYANLDPCG